MFAGLANLRLACYGIKKAAAKIVTLFSFFTFFAFAVVRPISTFVRASNSTEMEL
jgi:hypothetical protein